MHLWLRFDDDALERQYLQGREKFSVPVLVGVYGLAVVFSPVRLGFLARDGLQSSWTYKRFVLSAAQAAVTAIGVIMIWLQRRISAWGESYEKVLLLQLGTICLLLMMAYHPWVDHCDGHADCQSLRSSIMVISNIQFAIALPICVRAGSLWLCALVPCLATAWCLAISLGPLILSQSAFDMLIVTTWECLVLVLEILFLGYFQERAVRQRILIAEQQAAAFAKTEKRLRQDGRLASALLRLAMARFEVVLSLTSDFRVGSASEQADELLGTEALGVELLSLLEVEDAIVLRDRCRELAQKLQSAQTEGVASAATTAPEMTTTVFCKLRAGGPTLRIVASPNGQPDGPMDISDIQYVLGIERCSLEMEVAAIPDARYPLLVQRPLARSPRRRRPTAGTPSHIGAAPVSVSYRNILSPSSLSSLADLTPPGSPTGAAPPSANEARGRGRPPPPQPLTDRRCIDLISRKRSQRRLKANSLAFDERAQGSEPPPDQRLRSADL